jgi:hypothetical protein
MKFTGGEASGKSRRRESMSRARSKEVSDQRHWFALHTPPRSPGPSSKLDLKVDLRNTVVSS